MAYKTKPCGVCNLPALETRLNVLILNASLKHKPDISNTGELAELVVSNMKQLNDNIYTEEIRLSDKYIPVGLDYRENEKDEWPEIAKSIREADIIIFATPIWWGGRSSLMQRIIERLDAFDEDYIKSGRSALYNKVAGIVITGSEDGALSTLGTIMMVLTFMGFTFPPECAAYYVGEVGTPVPQERDNRLKNEASQHMAKNLARNLLYYSQLLKIHPLEVN